MLLYATNLRQLTCLLRDVQAHAAKCGLLLHPEKTKILTNISWREGRTITHVNINGDSISILHSGHGTKYLGRQLTFHDFHDAELHNRIAAGWARFHQLRYELTNKRFPLHSRLRLFNGTVTPSVLYGCSSWTLTKEMLLILRRVQRKMLRLVTGVPRRRNEQHQHTRDTSDDGHHHNMPDANTANNADYTASSSDERLDDGKEPWAGYIRRTTHEATDHASRTQVK